MPVVFYIYGLGFRDFKFVPLKFVPLGREMAEGTSPKVQRKTLGFRVMGSSCSHESKSAARWKRTTSGNMDSESLRQHGGTCFELIAGWSKYPINWYFEAFVLVIVVQDLGSIYWVLGT